MSIGMVSLQEDKPKLVNGIFSAAKGEIHRLLINAENANKVFKDPPKVDLPNPGILIKLHLPKGEVLYVSKYDMDNYYHRMRIPTWITQIFEFPSVRVEGRIF